MSLAHLCGQGKHFTWDDTVASLPKGELPSCPFLVLPARFCVPAVGCLRSSLQMAALALEGAAPWLGRSGEQRPVVMPALALATNPACWMVGMIKIELVLYYRPGRRILLRLPLHNRARIDLLQQPSSCASKQQKVRAQDSLK